MGETHGEKWDKTPALKGLNRILWENIFIHFDPLFIKQSSFTFASQTHYFLKNVHH